MSDGDLLLTIADLYIEVGRLRNINDELLAALESFASNFGGDAGLEAAMRIGLDAELIEARAAIAKAEAAGIKVSR